MTFKISSFYVIIAFLFYSVQGQCRTPTGTSGQCILIQKCEPLLKMIKNQNRTPEDVQFIKKSQCGYENKNPQVCCPDVDRCITPDGREGACVDLYSCPAMTRLSKPPISKDVLTFLQNSRCNGPNQYSVCCGPDVTTEAPRPNKGGCQPSAAPPDPSTECCGLDSSSGKKNVGGKPTAIDQYPWLVLLEHAGGARSCGGSLISSRFVLTTAHCLAGVNGLPKIARLAEYNITSSPTDIAEVEGGGFDQIDNVFVPVESGFIHPDFSFLTFQHDVGLIKLARPVEFSEFTMGTNFTVAGWGVDPQETEFFDVKKEVTVPYVPMNTCRTIYSTLHFTLSDNQICAGSEGGNDTCKGDSGGPLMYESDQTYIVVGVVSYGPRECGIKGQPAVYTHIFKYLNWINSVIQGRV